MPTHIQPAPRDHSANIDPAISGGGPPPGGMIPAPSDLPGDASQQQQHHQHQHQQAQQAQQAQQQAGQQQMEMEESPDDHKTYGKRELSSSKRAAQNRAAQVGYQPPKRGFLVLMFFLARIPPA